LLPGTCSTLVAWSRSYRFSWKTTIRLPQAVILKRPRTLSGPMLRLQFRNRRQSRVLARSRSWPIVERRNFVNGLR
jgi:hypothetical protein